MSIQPNPAQQDESASTHVAGGAAASGARQALAAEHVQEVIARLCELIPRRYGVAVNLVEVPPPFLGDLDGAEIYIQRHEPGDALLFTLAHLFGHTVQWNTDERLRTLGGRKETDYTAAEMQQIEAYERDASRYGMQLLHEAGVHDLDQWLTDFAACDFAYLKHFYQTGERHSPLDFWCDDQPLLDPLPIPRFTPRRYKLRWQGVVV